MSEEVAGQPAVLVVGGPLDGHAVRLTPGLTLIIGSGRLANLRLDHPEIELAHIKIAWDDLGISMVDNGSRRGTWVNGEPVETAALLDGDTIEFAAPGSRSTPPLPKLRLKVPKGAVPEPPPMPSPPAGEAAPAAAPARAATAKARGKALRRTSRLRLPDVDLRLVGLAAGGLVLLVAGGRLAKQLFFTAPQIVAVEPAQAEMGQTITLSGKRFDPDVQDNKVWFGTLSVVALSATHESIQVRVPMLPAAGTVAVSVETRAGPSRPASLLALAPLQASSLDPPGALPGEEVVMSGSGFKEGVSVTVGAQAAPIVKVEPGAVRFTLPQLAGAPGSLHAVIASLSGRSTAPLQIYLGHLPLVASLQPSRGVAGDLVRVRGVGFAPALEENAVTFDGVAALVVAGTTGELVVVVPPGLRSQAESLVPVVVRTAGRSSEAGPVFTLLRQVEGSWVPRFLAGAVGEGGRRGQATVGTELAPVLLLSWKDEARSVGERALSVAAALNAAVDRARVGAPVAFEAREEPELAVAIVGAPDLVVRVFPQDAAGYETPPGLEARGAPPVATALARHWAALLTNTVAIGTSGARPRASAELGPGAAAAFTQLRALLPWQYGSGVAVSRVIGVPAELRRKLREAAFRVP